MELFNIYNNHIVRVLPFAISRLISDKKMSKVEFEQFLVDTLEASGPNGVDFVSDKHVKSVFFNTNKKNQEYDLFVLNKDENKKLYVSLNDIAVKSPLPIVFSKQEKEYIRLMLEDKEARCFMSEELIAKLRDEFDRLGGYDVSHITGNYIEREVVTEEIDESQMRKHILVIAEALRHGKKIKYVYASKDGEYEGIGSPYRFMYSLRNRVICLALHPDGPKKRFIKMNVSRFKNVELTDIDIDFDPEEQFYKKQRRRLILRTDNNKSKKSVERCMRIFSSYKRRTVYDKKSDTVNIALDFYCFDEESIINDIISLGSTVEVIEVQRYDEIKKKYVTDTKSTLRETVIKRLLQMYNNMP